MHEISRGKNISIHFTESELRLLNEWEAFCKNNFTTKSGWVKRNIHKTLKEAQTVQ